MQQTIKIAMAALLIQLFLFQSSVVFAQIERIEPPFWWAGMVNKELQLMVYGPDAGKMKVSSGDANVKVKKARSAENPNYLFVDLELSSSLQPGDVELSFTSADGESIRKMYNFRERRAGSRERIGFSSKDVIYLATPDRFANGDTSNDSVDSLYEKADRNHEGGRHGGDLIGLADHLDYLYELGITMVWLNPLQENNQEEYSYHGYSISDLYNIDARFGGNEALLAFTAKARKMGIGLIMDTIPNHIGLNHWWMKDLPSKDWVNNEGKFFQTSHRHEMIQDPYAPDSDRREFNDGWFVPTMPDLNQRNPDVATYFIQNNIWWVEYADLAGLRVDTLPYAEKEFTKLFNESLLREYPNLNIVGEEWSVNPAVVAYWQKGKKNQDGFDAGSPSLMDFPLQQAIVSAVTEEEGHGTGMIRLHEILSNDFQYPDPGNLVVISDNHDMSRIFTQVGENYRLYKMALTYLMTTRGIPQLFYGTEILMKNPGTDSHGIIRSDFPGGWPGDQRNAFTGQGMTKAEIQAQQFVRKLLNWRKQATAVHNGKLTHYLPKEGIYTFFRQDDKQLVIVVMNNNLEDREVATKRFSEVAGGVTTKKDIFSGKTSDYKSTIKVPAKTALVFELK